MSKITMKEAINLTDKSESTLRRDMRSGKVSYSKNETGRLEFDSAELVRVYGQLKPVDTANDTTNDREMNGHDTPVDTPKVIALLETQISSLQTQLTQASEREKNLLDLLKEREKNLARILPATAEKKPFFFGLFGKPL